MFAILCEKMREEHNLLLHAKSDGYHEIKVLAHVFNLGNELNLFFLVAIFILHSQESELYRYTLDGTSSLAWEFLFPRCLGHLSFT